MSHPISRRNFLQGAAVAAAAPATVIDAHAGSVTSLLPPPAVSPETLARDTRYWNKIAGHYAVSRDFVNLENAYYGVMATPVMRDFKRNIDTVNKDNSRLLRQQFDRAGSEAIRLQLAGHLGVAANEIALTRGATESLQNLISNYQALRSGDTVMYGDLDYDAMQYAMADLAARKNANLAIVRMPEPASRQAVLDTYDAALRAHPRTKLLLLTHVSHRTGLLFPVAEIAAMARQRGIDVIVDIAHSWGQTPFHIPDLHADFVGGNLHKWIGAPLGLGFMYIRKERLADIGVHLGDRDFAADDIRSRVHTGTVNAAAVMSIPAALAFHDAIGTAAKSARLRYLRDYWVSKVRASTGLEILTPDEQGMYGAITSFRVKGKTTPEENSALVKHLMTQHAIFTVARHGPAGGSCIRITPALYTRTSDLDRLVDALGKLG